MVTWRDMPFDERRTLLEAVLDFFVASMLYCEEALRTDEEAALDEALSEELGVPPEMPVTFADVCATDARLSEAISLFVPRPQEEVPDELAGALRLAGTSGGGAGLDPPAQAPMATGWELKRELRNREMPLVFSRYAEEKEILFGFLAVAATGRELDAVMRAKGRDAWRECEWGYRLADEALRNECFFDAELKAAAVMRQETESAEGNKNPPLYSRDLVAFCQLVDDKLEEMEARLETPNRKRAILWAVPQVPGIQLARPSKEPNPNADYQWGRRIYGEIWVPLKEKLKRPPTVEEFKAARPKRGRPRDE